MVTGKPLPTTLVLLLREKNMFDDTEAYLKNLDIRISKLAKLLKEHMLRHAKESEMMVDILERDEKAFKEVQGVLENLRDKISED